MCQRLPCLFRDYVDEERAEKQVAAIMQKTLDRQDSLGRKFFYAISRSDCISFTNKPMWHLKPPYDARNETYSTFCRYQPLLTSGEAGRQLTNALET